MAVTKVQSGRIVAFDAIRAVSILWIVGVWHLFDYFPGYAGLKGDVAYRITVGLLGSFVLISGFLMGRRPVPVGQFYRARFARIYPPFLLACLAFGLIGLGTWPTMLKGAALVGMFAGPAPYTLWFINMIVLFYAATPALMQIRSSAVGYGLLCGAIAVLLALGPDWLVGMSPRLAMYFPCYALGLWLAREGRPVAQLCLIGGLMVMAAGLAMMANLPAPTVENSTLSAIWACGVALALFGGAQMAEKGLSGWRWPEPIAYASYFLYLFHRVVYALALKPVAHASDGIRLMALLIVALPVALALAWRGQKFYDATWNFVQGRNAQRPIR